MTNRENRKYNIILALMLTFFVYVFVVNLWPSYVVDAAFKDAWAAVKAVL